MLVGREGSIGGGGGFDPGWEKEREDDWRIGKGGAIGSGAGARGMAAVVDVLLGGCLCSFCTSSNLCWLRLGGGGSGAFRAFIFAATGVEAASLVAAAVAPKREILGEGTDAVD